MISSKLTAKPLNGQKIHILLLFLLGFLLSISSAEDGQFQNFEGQEPPQDDLQNLKDLPNQPTSNTVTKTKSEQFLSGQKPSFKIDSIHPAHGPITGATRVKIRGGPFEIYQNDFPEPKCRFGSDSMIVGAAYVACKEDISRSRDREGQRSQRTSLCIQCENTPPTIESKPVEFTLSLTGDFSDVQTSAQFYFYKIPKITAIKPHQGPKDGGTTIQVWGENFVDFGDDTICGVGVKAVSAKILSPNYMTCVAPASDVVQRAMPFAISLNGQQMTRDPIDYWYYNNPQVTLLTPSIGPENGGNTVELRGESFQPFGPDDIDISNSTFCSFVAINQKVKAIVTNQTRAECVAPPSYFLKETAVELTLNDQDYTDDNTLYHYYEPPFLFDAQPQEGPVDGGTKVIVIGSDFNNTGNITCKFGKKEVKGTYISSSEILCISPSVKNPGFVDLMISLYPGLYSTPVKYLYYQNPTIAEINPKSGPLSGFTQLVVKGDNFVDLGNDKAMCVFNKTIFTNATVISQTLLICDTPSILNSQGYPSVDVSGRFYLVDVTIDGGIIKTKSGAIFDYYDDPIIESISPKSGPIKGGTLVTIKGKGFAQKQVSKRVIRLGHLNVEPLSFTNDTITFKTPAVAIQNTVDVALSLNGQQFAKTTSVHYPKESPVFDYYVDPYVSLFTPRMGPNNGGTVVTIQGYNFMLDRPHYDDKIWARFVDPASQQPLAPATQAVQNQYFLDQFKWVTPVISNPQSAVLQISLNQQDWVELKNPNDGTSFTIYQSPHVKSISPSFGHVKAVKDQVITIQGSGFECFDAQCSDLYCRFGNQPSHYIYIKGSLVDSENVRCKVPEYTKPDVVGIEITINGESFTSDNKTFGFFDPFVINAEPRLISIDGSTMVRIKGIGFVDSGESKSVFTNKTNPIHCGSGDCVKQATFIDKETLLSPTFPQAETKYKDKEVSVMWDPIFIDATVMGDEFTDNQVTLFYYEEPKYSQPPINESPANVETNLLIPVDFKLNDKDKLLRLGTPRCKFSFKEKVAYSDGLITAYPFEIKTTPENANTIHCKSPRWSLDGESGEKATLDISINGQNFAGNFEFTFTPPLILYRDAPMSGPVTQQTATKLIGSGFRMQRDNATAKWGIEMTDKLTAVEDFVYKDEDFLDIIHQYYGIRAYWTETDRIAKVDLKMTEGQVYDQSRGLSSVLRSNDDLNSLGGPQYVEIGLIEKLRVIRDDKEQLVSIYNFPPSAVEFYQFKDPIVKQIFPTNGLTRGGTLVSVIGTWFSYRPEYGVVPHCRFGDQIVRAFYDSSVRLVCQSPPNSVISHPVSFEVSQNGVDWSETGFTFSYYEEPIMTDIYPDMGSVAGSEDIFIKGEKFANISDQSNFLCRFTPTTVQMPAKIVKAKYLNTTTILCTSPGGWSHADKMILQVTWNGVDYDNNQFQYTFYSIHKAFPRSGPSNGKGGDILIIGEGFREDTNPACKLNNTVYDPVSVTPTEIRCPMPGAIEGDDFFGNVPLSVTANGINWHEFDGGFQYYPQPIVEDISPKNGPSTGKGIINFYGQGFRADYPLAELGCRIGSALGKGTFISSRQIQCIVNDIPLVQENDDALPAQVSLNSYSYSEVSDSTTFRPYGIQQVSPNSGPTSGVTTIIVKGQGFVEEDGLNPRCRFGTPANYAIVEGEVLSYTRLACKMPDHLAQTPTSSLPRDLPISVALQNDDYDPWTQTSHRVRFYEQPKLEKVLPEEVEIGRIVEVYVFVADDYEFFEPMLQQPLLQVSNVADTQNDENQQKGQDILSPIKCKFGRFGETNGIFINQTTIKCTTPATDIQPDQIYRERIIFSVGMNGQDFMEDESEVEFTFIGTASYLSFATIIMFVLAVAFVGFAIVSCTSNMLQRNQILQSVVPNRRGREELIRDQVVGVDEND